MLRALLTTLLLAVLQVTANTFERIDRNNVALLIVDHQVGLVGNVRDYSVQEMYNNIVLHATLGKTYNLPVVITSSTDQGPNGPLLPEITEMYPNHTIIHRQGEIDAWDNADFRAAVQATGRKQVIIAGITTDVCTMLAALSLREAGYTVFANADASGAVDARAADRANVRMTTAGVYVLSQGSIVADLQRDWRNPTGNPTFLELLFNFFPTINNVIRQHGSAIKYGALAPGEDQLV